MREHAYDTPHYTLSEVPHAYGDNVHILGDPFSLGLLARLCAASTTQPAFNELMRELYRHLFISVVNHGLPRRVIESQTRMAATTARGVFRGSVLDPDTKVVGVDVARAGILPAMTCYDLCNRVLTPENIRQDHLIMARNVNADGVVIGATINGEKVGGTIDDRYVLFPDPMGATGSSLAEAIDYYKGHHGENPTAVITMNLIITPKFIETMQRRHPEVHLYALRLDRGMSPEDVLRTGFGERRDEETGLNELDYIIPGGGGFGELMNNSWI
jgi:uracil phosphoribosyltransferase